ncbi:MAG: hypothetical protein HGA49_00340 [Eubacteriaceae bacterium]|nr:hypothetical protein [Eubacteriaceae bacterium]
MTIAGKVGAVFLQTEEPPASFIKASTIESFDRTSYTIGNEIQRYLDKNSPVTIYVNDVVITTGFSVQYLGGVVKFSIPQDPEDEVTVSGKSIEVDQVGGFFSWSAELSSDTADVTTFESAGWKDNLPTINGFSASTESYWLDEKLSGRLGQEVIVALYLDASTNKKRYEGYGVISGDSIELSVDDVINESIEFEGSGKLYYRED